MTKIPESETLRYLGAAAADDPALLEQVHELCAQMEQQITPKSIWREFPCEVTEDAVFFGGITFAGKDLARHLKGCSSLLLFAATLGAEADRMARTERVRAMTRGAIVHAAGAAMIEQFCDDTQDALAKEYEKKGLFLRPRYSPGYGDLALEQQSVFFRLLDLEKRLGLSLNEHYTMAPSKSVTAVIGISAEPKKSFRKFFKKKLYCKVTVQNKKESSLTFRSNRLLTEHFLKHGAEFPYSSAAEYLRGANRVIKDQNALHKVEAEDGDDVYYLVAANEIVFVSTDGYIRTYFKPDDGIDYFNRT